MAERDRGGMRQWLKRTVLKTFQTWHQTELGSWCMGGPGKLGQCGSVGRWGLTDSLWPLQSDLRESMVEEGSLAAIQIVP